jgi:hypothetical protein
MPFDHSVKSWTVKTQEVRRCLLVSPRPLQGRKDHTALQIVKDIGLIYALGRLG